MSIIVNSRIIFLNKNTLAQLTTKILKIDGYICFIAIAFSIVNL